jgi:hypothetical protein
MSSCPAQSSKEEFKYAGTVEGQAVQMLIASKLTLLQHLARGWSEGVGNSIERGVGTISKGSTALPLWYQKNLLHIE